MQIYGGVFLIAFTTLAYEVALTRLLSVVTWYHLAFFSVATAMLGMTAAGTMIFLRGRHYAAGMLHDHLAQASRAFGYSLPVALIVICAVPLGLGRSLMTWLVLLAVTLATAVPFFLSGIVVTLVLTRGPGSIGRRYAADLAGASLGCLFVLGALSFMDAPSVIIGCGALAMLAAVAFEPERARWRRDILVAAALLVAAVLNSATVYGVRPMFAKLALQNIANIEVERWNSFSRVTVQKAVLRRPHYWGPSPLAPRDMKIEQYEMAIDGGAATWIRRFRNPGDVADLKFDVTNVAYFLRPGGGACVIGVGGGRDLQSALSLGQKRVIGVDVNPIFIDLLQHRFRTFAGLADRPGVEFVKDEARSYLARSRDRFAVIQMSLIDTWAATGAGAFALSENALYTTEAWRTFVARLADDGVFTVSRWYSPDRLGETGRLMSLATATVLELGSARPADHIALVTSDRIATLILARRPLSPADIDTLKRVAAEYQFDLPVLPGAPVRDDALRAILSARSRAELERIVADQPLNFLPATDESPYFFNMLRLGHLHLSLTGTEKEKGGLIAGNLRATVTLIALIAALLAISVVTILVPLWRAPGAASPEGGDRTLLWPAAAYFALIGAGFMFVEMGLMQRLGAFLSHPIHALGIVLFTIILSAGVGALLSERLPVTPARSCYIYPVVMVAVIVIARFALQPLFSRYITEPVPVKIGVAVLALFPIGVLLGIFFPTGMRLVAAGRATETPWYWALNGIFGVVATALAVFVAIYSGISMVFDVAAVCYAALLLCLRGMTSHARSRAAVGAAVPAQPRA